MTEKIAIFYLIVFIVLVALRRMRPNIVTFVAFSWFGPFPKENELLSSFKARRIRYAFSWVIQFVAYFAILALFGVYFNSYFSEGFFLVGSFAGTIGMGMAILACTGFSLSWLKTITVGPNPKCEYIEEHEEST
jgi:hypothetical protein